MGVVINIISAVSLQSPVFNGWKCFTAYQLGTNAIAIDQNNTY